MCENQRGDPYENEQRGQSEHEAGTASGGPDQIALGHLKPEEVKRGEVRALVDRLSERAPVMANRVFEVTRRLYTWAIGKDLVETSPCVGLSKPSPETQRHRVLTEDEIRAVWAACDSEPGIIGDAFRLMLVTAQRRGEVGGEGGCEHSRITGRRRTGRAAPRRARVCSGASARRLRGGADRTGRWTDGAGVEPFWKSASRCRAIPSAWVTTWVRSVLPTRNFA